VKLLVLFTLNFGYVNEKNRKLTRNFKTVKNPVSSTVDRIIVSLRLFKFKSIVSLRLL